MISLGLVLLIWAVTGLFAAQFTNFSLKSGPRDRM